MTTTALTITDRALITTDVMTAFGAFLWLYVADRDVSPETIRGYYGNTAQFIEAACLEGLRPVLATPPLAQRPPRPALLPLPHPPHPGPFDFAQGRLGSRQREYVGADPGKQAEALARVEAHEKLVQVRAEMRETDHRLAAITGHRSAERSRRSLARALLAAIHGLDSHW